MLPTDTVPTCHVVPEGVYAWTAEMPLQWFPVWKELAAANTEEGHPWVQAVEDVSGSETQAVKQPTSSGILASRSGQGEHEKQTTVWTIPLQD